MKRVEGMTPTEFRDAVVNLFRNSAPLTASILGISRQTVYLYMRGKSPVPTNIRNTILFAEALGLDRAVEILGYLNPKPIKEKTSCV